MKPTSFPIALALVATIAAASVLIPVGDPVVPYKDAPASSTDPREGRVDAAGAEADMLMGIIEKEKLPQPSAQRMCQDLFESSAAGDFDAFDVFRAHCPRSDADMRRYGDRYAEKYLAANPPPPLPIRRERVVLDTAQLQKAQDCDGLRAKADGGDPVAKYDIVQLWKAGLCRR